MSNILDNILTENFSKYNSLYSPSMRNLLSRLRRSEFLMANNVYDFYWKNCISSTKDTISMSVPMSNLPNSTPPWLDVFVGFSNQVKLDISTAGLSEYKYTMGGGAYISTRRLTDRQELDVLKYWEDSGTNRGRLYAAGVRWISYIVPIVKIQGKIDPPMTFTVIHIHENGSIYPLPVGRNVGSYSHQDIKRMIDNNEDPRESSIMFMSFHETDVMRRESIFSEYSYQDYLDEVRGWAPDISVPALMSFSFIHCRNVEMDTHQRRKGGKKKRVHREKSDKIIFKTIRIESVKRILESEGRLSENGLGTALHLCRGHFKDYRHGSGLFGKHREIYWWDEQWRGDSDYGTVLKDYVTPDVNIV